MSIVRVIVIVFPALIFSCQQTRERAEAFPIRDEEDWFVYEGRVPLDEKKNLYIELALNPSGTIAGEGSYKLTEILEEGNALSHQPPLTGTYATYGNNPDELVIQLYHSSLAEGFKRVYISKTKKRLVERYFQRSDLRLKRLGDHKLFVLDGDEAITLDENANLIKRSSKLFTVEGYFRHNVDSAVFYEMNTKERWSVAKYGAYEQATREYHMLVNDKFDAIYLKGIGFSFHYVNTDGQKTEALVFKKILQTSFNSN